MDPLTDSSMHALRVGFSKDSQQAHTHARTHARTRTHTHAHTHSIIHTHTMYIHNAHSYTHTHIRTRTQTQNRANQHFNHLTSQTIMTDPTTNQPITILTHDPSIEQETQPGRSTKPTRTLPNRLNRPPSQSGIAHTASFLAHY